MNTSTVILNTATILRAIARASLAVAWLFAQHHTTAATGAKSVEPSVEASAYAEAAPYTDVGAYSVVAPLARTDCARTAPLRYIEQTPTAAPAAAQVKERPPEPRSKCGDLPRAPWNTCVALHDHEI